MKVKRDSEGKVEGVALNLQEEFEVAYQRFLDTLEHSASFATLSEQLNEMLKAGTDLPDPPHPIRFGVKGKTARDVAGADFLDRSVRQSVTSVLIGVEECLLAPYVLLSLWRDLRSRDGNRANFVEIVEAGRELRRNTRHEHVWDLLKAECKAFGFKLKFEYENEYTSLRKMRNCLAHRNGVVADFDVEKDGYLTLRWKDVIPLFKGKEVTQVPFQAPESGGLRVQFEKRSRKYRPRERVAFDARDCHSILWTLLHFVRDVLTLVDRAITSDQQKRGI